MPFILCAVCHNLRMVFLPVRVGKSPLLFSFSPLADTTYCGEPNDCENDCADGGVDGDLSPGGEASPSLCDSLGWWTVESFRDRGVASAIP